MQLLERADVMDVIRSKGKTRGATSVRCDVLAGLLKPFAITPGRRLALYELSEVERYVAGLA